VIHAAGLIKARHRAAFHAGNVGGTEKLVAALNDCAVPKRLILVSSMVAREPALSAYAETKRAGETALAQLRHGRWCVVRPCAVYGPWDRETLAIFQAAARGIFPMAGPRQGRVALIHAADAARAVVALCSETDSGRIFELTDRRTDGYRWDEIAAAAEQAVGTRVRQLLLPAPAVRGAAFVNAAVARLIGRTPILTPGKAREILHADWGSAAERQPSPDLWRARIGLGDGFRDTAQWYRERGWLSRQGQE
jgi:nucleoside-diphosphate-sugar epimerase